MATPYNFPGLGGALIPSTAAQSAALQNLAQPNLVKQLFAGKPAAQTPPVVAASGAVKNQNAPVSAPTPTSPQLTFAGGTNAQGQGIGSIIPSGAPATQTTTPSTIPTQTASTGASSASAAAPTVTYPGLINTLAQTSQQGSPVAQNTNAQLAATSAASSPTATAAEQATAQAGLLNPGLAANAQNIGNQYSTEMNNLVNEEGATISGDTTGGAGPIGLGRAGAIEANVGAQLTGEANAENAALAGNAQGLTAAQQQASAEAAAGGLANTQQGLIQSGLNSAAGNAQTQQGLVQSGLASAVTAAAPVSQYGALTSPLTGQPISSAGVGSSPTTDLSGNTLSAPAQSALSVLPQSGQQAVLLQAQRVQQGLTTVPDALTALSAYSQGGVNALQQVLGPNFNVNASNASAGTTATGQQIQTAATAANSALDTLTTAFQALNPAQTGGIPLTNNIANWIATNLGQAALTTYQTNLSDARSQLVGVLNASGGTPTGNEQTALDYLPDNMTVAQFNQNVGTAQNPGIVRQLIAQKVGAFVSSGQPTSTGTSGTGTTPMFGNFNG